MFNNTVWRTQMSCSTLWFKVASNGTDRREGVGNRIMLLSLETLYTVQCYVRVVSTFIHMSKREDPGNGISFSPLCVFWTEIELYWSPQVQWECNFLLESGSVLLPLFTCARLLKDQRKETARREKWEEKHQHKDSLTISCADQKRFWEADWYKGSFYSMLCTSCMFLWVIFKR